MTAVAASLSRRSDARSERRLRSLFVSNSAAPEANIIFGAVIDDALGDEVRVTVIAAGFDEGGRRARPPRAASSFAADNGSAQVSPGDSYRSPASPAPSVLASSSAADGWASAATEEPAAAW